jgi:DNA invertase Pin-like site-specific DNA recombinase
LRPHAQTGVSEVDVEDTESEDRQRTLAAGDRLIVSELSRLGRSLGQVIRIVDELVKQKVRFVAI